MAYLGTSQGGVSRSPGTAKIRKGGCYLRIPSHDNIIPQNKYLMCCCLVTVSLRLRNVQRDIIPTMQV